jgi:hypothetical protein
MKIGHLSKTELKQLLTQTQAQIKLIDDKSIYSFSYYYYNDEENRAILAAQMTAIELEIIYRDDDDKFEKYKCMKNKDPLKYYKF